MYTTKCQSQNAGFWRVIRVCIWHTYYIQTHLNNQTRNSNFSLNCVYGNFFFIEGKPERQFDQMRICSLLFEVYGILHQLNTRILCLRLFYSFPFIFTQNILNDVECCGDRQKNDKYASPMNKKTLFMICQSKQIGKRIFSTGLHLCITYPMRLHDRPTKENQLFAMLLLL